MLTRIENRKIYMASEPVDFRLSMDGLSKIIEKSGSGYLHDGSIFVFYNKNRNRMKCMFWDRNGFVLYYKRLENLQFKFRKMMKNESITAVELEVILSGMTPVGVE